MSSSNELSNNYLLEQGIVLLVGEIDISMAQVIVCQLQYLATKYPHRPIQVWINSPGGDINAGMAIYDVINYISVEVHTIAIGLAASMGAFLLSSGTRGKRCALPNAEILIHQPLGGAQGQATDIINAAKHIEAVRSKINNIMARNSRQEVSKIEADTDRDNIMTAEEAKHYGLIDIVIETAPKAW